ncbi:MAG TPA: hypothetical protein VJ724_13605 [Tahibacter sp.]|nr:hypothetical protein [Tahibacter sp.]
MNIGNWLPRRLRQRWMRLSPPLRACAGLFVLSGTVVLVLAGIAPSGSTTDTISMEIVKAFLQVGVVSVFGGVLAYVLAEHQKAGQDFDRRNERTLRFLLQMKETYYGVKKVRRSLRAYGATRHALSRSDYERCFQHLIDHQLSMESLAKDLSLFGYEEASRVRSLEKYLNKLVEGYENENSSQEASIQAGPLLFDFVGPREEFGKFNDFVNEYDGAYQSLARRYVK